MPSPRSGRGPFEKLSFHVQPHPLTGGDNETARIDAGEMLRIGSAHPISAFRQHYNKRSGLRKKFAFTSEGYGNILYNFPNIDNLLAKKQHPAPSPQSPELDKASKILVTGNQ